MSTVATGSDQEDQETPSKRKSTRSAAKVLKNKEEGGASTHAAHTQQTPTKRKRRKVKAYLVSRAKDDIGETEEAEVETFQGDSTFKEPTKGMVGSRVDRRHTNDQEAAAFGLTGDEAQDYEAVTIDALDESAQSEQEDQDPVPTGRSSGRQRRRPRRYSIEIEETTKPVQTPLSSSAKKRGRPRKNLVIKGNNSVIDEERLGFRDIVSHKSHEVDISRLEPEQEHNNALVQVDNEDPSFTTPKKKRGRPPKKPESASKTDQVALAKTFLGEEITVEDSTITSEAEHLKQLLSDEDSVESLTFLKSHVLAGLTGKRRLMLLGLEDEYQKVHQIVEQTVTAGEGNSMLIIGARGTAKTNLVETVLSDIGVDHSEDFHTVRLSGFIHTDDKLALKEIWRQLGCEMATDDDSTSAPTNYSDTLASLLALLSHPTEFSSADSPIVESQTTKSVIFILDEFDLFTTHPRQTLLYNLFDIAQSRKVPICVLGLTAKLNVVESLEKRVKSRFSHRYIHVPRPKSFLAFREICISTLTYQDSNHLSSSHPPAFPVLASTWSSYITALMHDPVLTDFLQRIYTQSKSVPAFLSASQVPICSLTRTSLPTASTFLNNTLSAPDSKLHLLSALSDAELALLVSAARLDVVLGTDTCNFGMAYEEYMAVAGRAKAVSGAVGTGMRVWGREVAMGAWERLGRLGLLMEATGVGGKEGGRAERMWRVDVSLEELGLSGAVGGGMERWCREI